jgi:UDP-N-acetylmuramate dehydrogenase
MSLHIQHNISLKPFNTFGVEARAEFYCEVKSKDDMLELIHEHLPAHPKSMILGGGSNVLFLKDFDGLVIKNEIIGIETHREDEQHVWVDVLSGTNWHELVRYCIGRGWGGIENLSLIPGTVGAAPMQNIGAYGVELENVFVQLEAIELKTGDGMIFHHADCEFGYRDSIFKRKLKGRYFIYSVQLKLSKQPKLNTSYGDIQKVLDRKHITQPDILEVSDAVIEIRSSKLPDPKELGNAGSFFKNPEVEKKVFFPVKHVYKDCPHYVMPGGKIKIPAAWLIEQCGWKGKVVGETGNHAKQALVIVNYGQAGGQEIWQHAQRVQQSVQEKFGIRLEPEVNLIG